MPDSNLTSPPKTKEYRNITLKNSVEIMGELGEINKDFIFIKKVFKVSAVPQNDTPEPIMVLTAYQLHTNLHENLPVRVEDILFVGRPDADMIAHYTKMTSPIIQKSNKIIMQ